MQHIIIIVIVIVVVVVLRNSFALVVQRGPAAAESESGELSEAKRNRGAEQKHGEVLLKRVFIKSQYAAL